MSKSIIFISTVISLLCLAGLGVWLWSEIESSDPAGLPGAGDSGSRNESSGPGPHSTATAGIDDAAPETFPGANREPSGSPSDPADLPGRETDRTSGTDRDPPAGASTPTESPEVEDGPRVQVSPSTRGLEFGEILATTEGTALLVLVENEEREGLSGQLVVATRGTQTLRSTTDEGGLVLFEKLRAGRYELAVQTAEGLQRVALRPLTLEDGEKRDVTLRLVSLDATITGRVLDSSGEPVEGITIQAAPLDQDHHSLTLRASGRPAVARSDADGAYLFEELAEGSYLLRTSSTQDWPSATRTTRAPASDVDIVLFEEMAFEVVGFTLDPDGVALGGVSIFSSGRGPRALSADDGSYTLEFGARLNPGGRVVILAQKEGYARNETVLLKSTLIEMAARGEQALELDIVLEPEGAVGDLEVRLLGPDGRGVAGESLYLNSPSLQARYTAVSGERGLALFERVRVAEDYRLQVHPRRLYRDVELQPISIIEGANTVDVELEELETGTLIGTLLDASGRGLGGFDFHVRSQESMANSLAASTDGQGRFHLEGVPAGNLLLESRGLPRLSVRGITLDANRELEVRVRTGFGEIRLEGRVTDRSGQPVTGARVLVTLDHREGSIQSSVFHETVTDASGHYQFTGLGEGPLKILASAPGHVTAQKTETLVARSPFRLDLQLRAR